MSNTNCTNCENINGCDGCRGCDGCDGCYGCRSCYGCYGCRGCDGCCGCYYSYGLKDCKAIYRSIMCTNTEGAKYMIFNKQVNKNRYDFVMNGINNARGVWYPKETNAFELYVKAGSEWSKINTSELTYKNSDDEGISTAWEDMPEELDQYFRSLPEFDSEIYHQITGRKEDSRKQELLKKAEELIKKAQELKEEANKF